MDTALGFTAINDCFTCYQKEGVPLTPRTILAARVQGQSKSEETRHLGLLIDSLGTSRRMRYHSMQERASALGPRAKRA